MTGIILSGGENRRMGRDKAFLLLDGKPLIEHILDVLNGLFNRIIIVTNTPDPYTSYGATVVTDALETRGPLTGIYTGLLHSADEYNFVVACDMPFLKKGLISYMKEAAGGFDAVVPRTGDLIEPLHAMYHRRLVPVIEQHLRRDERRIQGLFDHIRVRYLFESEIDRFDPEKRSFKNLNTPQEYKEAVCSDWECRS